MKKSIIASIIALGVMGGVAHAADGEVQFIGAVTTKTCDLATSVNGVLQTNNVIQLGTVAPGVTEAPVAFALKAADPTSPDCASLTAQETAVVTWGSSALNATGLGATSGAATDSNVLLNSVNAKTPGAINANTNIVEFTADKVIGDGLQFNAALKGGTIPGDFKSVASFAVAYN